MRKWFVVPVLAILCLALGVGVSSAAKERSLVKVETSLGDMVIELFPEKAPKTVANFLSYVNAGSYDGTIFHRVIATFMIQGGGFSPDMRQRSTQKPIPNEANNGLKNERYTIAMARTDNPHSATNQFFINVVDNAGLNYQSSQSPQTWGYAVFGKVVDGMNVVDAIRRVPTGNQGMHQNVPREPVVIKKAYVFTLR